MDSSGLRSPVLFIVFNRPATTREVFEEIRRAKPSKLFIAADGPRPNKPGEADLCAQVRAIVSQVTWDCEVHTLYRDANLGCKEAVSSAITWFFDHVDEGIILEDDCLPDPSFFPFCQELLRYYRNDTRVMMIGGTNYVAPKLAPEESYYFSRYYPIWGWATWKRAWSLYDKQLSDWPRLKQVRKLNEIYADARLAKYFERAFDQVYAKQIDTWDYQWAYTCIFQSGLCAIPRHNLVTNIGYAGGTHDQPEGGRHFTGMLTQSLDAARIVHPRFVTPNGILDQSCIDVILPRSSLGKIIYQFRSLAGKLNYQQTDDSVIPMPLALINMLATLKNGIVGKKPDPREYSTIVGKGSVVPVQIEAYFLALNKYIGESSRVLDVGFGLGYGLNILAIKSKEVAGVDVDKKVYDYCMSMVMGRNPRLTSLNVYDGYHLEFPDNHFDVLTCVDVIEHVEDYHRLIDEMMRVSKKGVFISTPNRRPEYTNKDGTPMNYWHLREWSYQEFDTIAREHGEVDWNFINGPYDGPFTISATLQDDTLALSPFIFKS